MLCTPEICFFPVRGAFPNRCGKLSKVTEMDRFGVLFGRLVKEKRGIEGLSQDGLAGKCGLAKARISDIEKGKIGNPQAKTVDALCVALNISREERAACHAAPMSSLPPRLLEQVALLGASGARGDVLAHSGGLAVGQFAGRPGGQPVSDVPCPHHPVAVRRHQIPSNGGPFAAAQG